MAIHAVVMLVEDRFVGALSDGRQIDRGDFRELANALFHAGVLANDVRYEWRAGQRMITAGQQVALRAEMYRLERRYMGLPMAASASSSAAAELVELTYASIS
jgi:hypothetical protein